MNAPLSDIRILDLTQVQARPSCTQLLAMLGAEVIKVEEPREGDRARREMAHREDLDSFYFLVFNASKKSVSLDLKSGKGRELFLRLVEISDVVIENFGPGRMERFGLTYPEIKEVNPRIVFASIKGYGSYGPYARYKSFENIAQATGGAMSVQGEPEGEPKTTAAGIGDSGSPGRAVLMARRISINRWRIRRYRGPRARMRRVCRPIAAGDRIQGAPAPHSPCVDAMISTANHIPGKAGG